MRSIIGIVILYLFVSGSSSLQAQKAKTYIKAAEEFVNSHKYEDAIEQYSRAIELAPDNIDAYVGRGRIYEYQQNFNQASADYERALTFETKDEDLYYLAANASYKTKKYDKALAHLSKALGRDNNMTNALQLMVKVYIAMERYNDALIYANKALKESYNEYNYYMRGVVYDLLNNYDAAIEDFKVAVKKNKKFIEAYVELAKLSLKLGKKDQALESINEAIEINSKYTEAYFVRSEIYKQNLNYAEAINDMSKNIIIEPDNAVWYYTRGTYYLDYAQYQNAINDFTKSLDLDNKNANAYYKRAFAYEQIHYMKKAIADYEKLTALSEYDVNAKKLLEEARDRMFEINRESTPPIISLVSPKPENISELSVASDRTEVKLSGLITDENDIQEVMINGQPVNTIKTNDGYEFISDVNIEKIDKIALTATDVYNNQQQLELTIIRTEIDPPAIEILAPVASDNGEIYLDTDASGLYIEGKISDESNISSIMVDGVSASYRLNELNPKFTATIDIFNKNSFSVQATDLYGNTKTQQFLLNREAVAISQNNPMGKTWVIFIENSNYNSFASLEGPGKDVSMMRAALANYKIQNIIHKKDMSKEDLEKFFAIELRDLVRSNHVNSLVVWYAGHGKFVNETGYWIPIDATRDDEFTYFNINSLRASLQAYSSTVTHTLVITDACESGPTFYHAMRDIGEKRSCNNWEATSLKSSQVFSSAGYELAVDNSQFTKTFANTLQYSNNSCVSIEEIVETVTRAVKNNNQQVPKFGLIQGLEHEGGTFFFITKE